MIAPEHAIEWREFHLWQADAAHTGAPSPLIDVQRQRRDAEKGDLRASVRESPRGRGPEIPTDGRDVEDHCPHPGEREELGRSTKQAGVKPNAGNCITHRRRKRRCWLAAGESHRLLTSTSANTTHRQRGRRKKGRTQPRHGAAPTSADIADVQRKKKNTNQHDWGCFLLLLWRSRPSRRF